VSWLHVLIVAVDVYLLISLGPWIALQVVEWLLRGAARSAEVVGMRLRQLQEGLREQALVWSDPPRPGRYQEPDRLGQEGLASLRAIIAEATRLSPRSAVHTSTDLKLVDILCLRSWKPLFRALAARRGAQTLRRLLDQGDETLAGLREQQQVVRNIPSRVQAGLSETRAETRRLQAILEAEEEAGTIGLEETSQRLEMMASEIEQALDALAQVGQAEMPLVVQEVDQLLGMAGPMIEETRDYLDRAVKTRLQAQNLIARVKSGMALAEERWEGLKLRGAREPSLAKEMSRLQVDVAGLSKRARPWTLNAYQKAYEKAKALDARVESAMNRLDALDQIIVRSKEAIVGNVQALAQAHAAWNKLVQQDAWLDPDQSKSLIEKSAAAYMEAERQRGVGTTQSYEAAISLAQTAGQLLSQAQEATSALPDGAEQIRSLLEELSISALSDWRKRIEEVGQAFRVYARHWDTGPAGALAEATSELDRAEADLRKVPADVRLQRRLRQSEVQTLTGTLAHAHECLEKAKELVTRVEDEQQRIDALRHDLERAIKEMATRTLPAAKEQSQHMLPELRERLQALEASLGERAASLNDPAQVDYDEAAGEWLPFMQHQLQDLVAEHENSLKHYRAAAKEASRRLDRAWSRLSKLDPHQPPGPEEDIDQLVLDLDAWHVEAKRRSNDPLALREIVGRRATTLEERLEAAWLQIVEGRRALDALDRDYDRCAQATRALRTATREAQKQSHWPHITWSTDQAEHAWEEAISLERESRTALTLEAACDLLQRAVTAILRAEQLYARLERQMNTALRRLDEERRSAASALERARRRADQFKERGQLAEMAETQELCVRAARILDMAEAATTFEDALWHLRDAARTLA